MKTALEDLRGVLLDVPRSVKPRETGLTVVLDKGLGQPEVKSLLEVSASHFDYVKIGWGSALITASLEEKLTLYRARGVTPALGGSLFEYAFARGQAEKLLDFVRETGLSLEISDSIVEIPRSEKLKWIERFAAHAEVFSEVGRKIDRVEQPWPQRIGEELEAGAARVVIEGREIGPAGAEIRTDLIDLIATSFPAEKIIFEALERKQQVFLIKRLGPDVNLANILPHDLLTLESFRRGLKEHTLLHMLDLV